MLAAAWVWASSNFKWIVIAIAVVAALGVVHKLYKTIQENGEYKVIVETQQEALKNKQEMIDGLNRERKLREEVIADRDEELKALEEKYETVTDNLGSDADDQAVDSLKEYFKRIQ